MSGMIIRNVRYFDGSKEIKKGDLYIENRHYVSPFSETNAVRVIDGTGLTAIPGLVDLHLHGCNGFDVCDNSTQALSEISRYEMSQGTAYYMPATMTLDIFQLKHILQTTAAYSRNQSDPFAARIIGINLEGPFLNPEKCGAQDLAHILPPDIAAFEELRSAAGDMLRMVDIAPEMPGALELIHHINSNYRDILISLAHTNADYDCAIRAFNMGASHITHLFNAMPPLHHRAPGVIGAASEYGSCTVELICDGIHVHPAMIRAAFRLFAPENIIFVSDSMRATGLSDGTYTLGGQEVKVRDRLATLKKDGSIAGSVSTLMDCLRYAIKNANIPEADAIACATCNPARAARLPGQYGIVADGAPADILLVDKDYQIVHNLLC